MKGTVIVICWFVAIVGVAWVGAWKLGIGGDRGQYS